MLILAIDPGTEQSAIVSWDGDKILWHTKAENHVILEDIAGEQDADHLVIEDIRCYGQAVGQSILDTVFWTGRFYQEWCQANPSTTVHRIPRTDVKMHLCHTLTKISDSNIRQALIDRFGTPYYKADTDILYKAGPRKGQPKQERRPNRVYGTIVGDEWAAFALAICFYDKNMGSMNEWKGGQDNAR